MKLGVLLFLGAQIFAEGLEDDLRNPFSAPDRRSGMVRESSGAGKFGFEDLNFDGVRWSYLPRIRVTGVISVGRSNVASAYVEGLGSMVLREGDRVILPASSDGSRSAWFVVHLIEQERMTIGLDDGTAVTGRLF